MNGEHIGFVAACQLNTKETVTERTSFCLSLFFFLPFFWLEILKLKEDNNQLKS